MKVLSYIAIVCAFMASACSQPASAPPTPTKPTSTTLPQNGKNVTSTTEPKKSSTEKASSSTKYKRLGADVGDEQTKKNFKKCVDADGFFDRFANEGEGKCLKDIKLALMDCTLDSVRKNISADAKRSLNEKLAGDLDGYELDQCMDCAEDSPTKLCRNETKAQVGTKLFFIKIEDNTLQGKSLVMSTRPGQESGTKSKSTDEEE